MATTSSTGTLTKGARITGDQRGTLAGQLVERYAAGESIRAIAADMGRSYGFVHGVLKEAGAPLRARGGATRGAAAAEQAPAEKAMPTIAKPGAKKVKKKDAAGKAAKAPDKKSKKSGKKS